ncbi:hypothetical protein V6N13_034965 [Hibiscus sabdariffa]
MGRDGSGGIGGRIGGSPYSSKKQLLLFLARKSGLHLVRKTHPRKVKEKVRQSSAFEGPGPRNGTLRDAKVKSRSFSLYSSRFEEELASDFFKKPLVREGKEVTEGRDLYHFASSAFGDSTNRTEPEGNERSDLHSD